MENSSTTLKIDTKKMLLIFIGELFLLINIRIFGVDTFATTALGLADGYDILPNTVGYVLSFIGLSALVKYDRFLSYARILSAVSIVVSLLDFYRVNVFFEENNLILVISLVSMGVSMLLEVLRMFFLIKGIDNMVNKCKVHTLLDKANPRIGSYIMFCLIDFALLAVSNAVEVAYTLEIIFAIGMIVAHILIAVYIMNAKGELNNLEMTVKA